MLAVAAALSGLRALVGLSALPLLAIGGRRLLAGQFHLAAFAQAVRAAGHDGLADFETVGHGHFLAFGRTGLDVAHLHGVIRLHDVHEQACRATFERGRRNDDGVAQYVEQQADVDELVGKQAFVVVDEFGFRLDRAGGRIDLVIETGQRTGGELGGAGAVVCVGRQLVAGVHLLQHRRQIVFGNGEQYVDRLQLRDDDDRTAHAHVVARIDLTQADASGHGRRDLRVTDIHFRVVDLSLIGLHRALVLMHERLLRVELLLGNRILREQRGVAIQIDLRIRQQRFVAGQRAFVLGELRLVRTRIDLGQRVALFHHLAFLEIHLEQIAGHLRGDGDAAQRRDRAQRIERDVDVTVGDLRHTHGHWRAGCSTAGAATPGTRAAALTLLPLTVFRCVARQPVAAGRQQRRHDDNDDYGALGTAWARRRARAIGGIDAHCVSRGRPYPDPDFRVRKLNARPTISQLRDRKTV